MKKLVDNSKFTIIDAVALRQTRYLRKYYAYSRVNGEKEDCTDGEWARYALAIYRHKRVFIKQPSTFKSWLPVFCAMFGRDVNYQEPNKLDRTENQKDIEVFLM